MDSSSTSAGRAKLRVLVFVGFYRPGFRAGGPIQTISTLIGELSSEFDFFVVTRDHDLGCRKKYEGIQPGWNQVGPARVWYVGNDANRPLAIISAIRECRPDLLYFNSFWDPWFTTLPVMLMRWFRVAAASLLIAPRGEFSDSALAVKSVKKRIYLLIAKVSRLYSGLHFQASAEHESEDIRRVMGVSRDRIHVAANLISTQFKARGLQSKHDGRIQVVFVSRIARIKNLDFALRELALVRSNVVMDVYGPIVDRHYWRECRELAESLPENVKFSYRGELHPDDVGRTMAAYDALFLPTQSENFGHVIAESLGVGVRVLISDQTPWRQLSNDGLGWDLPLRAGEFARVIDSGALSHGRSGGGREKVVSAFQARPLVRDARAAHLRMFGCVMRGGQSV